MAKKAVKKAAARKAKAEPAQAPAQPVKKAAKKASRKGGQPEAVAIELLPVAAGPGPLEGVTVIELARDNAAQAAGLLLANFGAKVIHIDGAAPPLPDRVEPELQGRSATEAYLLRGKKRVALDLDKPAGREALSALIGKADLVLEDLTPARLKALELDQQAVRGKHSKLIWVSVTGFGRQGPYAGRSAWDLNVMALTGALDLLSGDGKVPALPGVQLADLAGGALPAVIGAAMALFARTNTGKGQHVDVASFDGTIGLLSLALAEYAATRSKPKRGHDALFGRYACYNVYPVRNGRWMALAALDPKAWAALCRGLDREAMIPEQYADLDRQQVLIAELTRVFQRRDIREWNEIFAGKDVSLTEVRGLGSLIEDEHALTRRSVAPTKRPEGGSYYHVGAYPLLSHTPGRLGEPTHELGADTEEVLKSAGLPKKLVEQNLR